jgi:hypothetical protein
MGILRIEIIALLLATLLWTTPARSQGLGNNVMQTMIDSACTMGAPIGLVEFKKRQIARRMADDQQTLSSLEQDRKNNVTNYTADDTKDYDALVTQMNAEITAGRRYTAKGCGDMQAKVAPATTGPAAAAPAAVPVDPSTAEHVASTGEQSKEDTVNSEAQTQAEAAKNEANLAATDAQTAHDNAVAKKALSDNAAQEAAAASKAAAIDHTAEKVAAAKTATDKATATKAASDKAAADSAAADRSAQQKAVAAKTAVDKAATASIKLSGTNLPFPKQDVGATSTTQTVTVTNSSGGPLTLNPLAPTGPNDEDFSVETNNCGAPIAPKGNCTFSVSFKPSEVGEEMASISVQSNEAGGTPISVALTGTGENPATPPTVYGPLVQQQKVVSGTADKKALSLSAKVFHDCNPLEQRNCPQAAQGYTANFRSDGMFSVELYKTYGTGNYPVIYRMDDKYPYTLQTNDFVMVTETVQTALNGGNGSGSLVDVPSDPIPLQVQQASYSESKVPWGNVTPTFSTGFMLSQNNGQFSQYNFFLDLNVDTSYHISGNPQRRLNAFFDAQLTSVPAASCQTTAGAGSSGTTTGASSGNSNAGANCFSNIGSSFNSFLSSQKAAVVQGGVYYPWLIPSAKWSYRGHANALFVGPLGKGGLQNVISTSQTTTNSTQSSSTTTPTNSTTTTSTLYPSGLYGYYAIGARLGHLQLWDSWNVAPDLLSYLDITVGKWTNLYQCPAAGCTTNSAGLITNLPKPFMLGVGGQFKVPSTPLILGFDTIKPFATSARTDFRFTVGIKTDLACLFTALSTPSVLNSSGSCEKTTGTTQKTTAETATLTITTSVLPDAPVNAAYSATIQLKGGKSPYKFTVTEGFPSGLKVSSSTGQITGAPTELGTDSFVVTVTDSSTPALTATKNLAIKITK